MLDARYVRENVDAVKKALADRGEAWDLDRFLALDTERRGLVGRLEERQARRNEASKAIGGLIQEGNTEEAEALKAEVREINEEIAEREAGLEKTDEALRKLLITVPNLPHESVPVGADEDENVEIRRWGEPTGFGFEPKAHWDLGPELGIIDFERGVKLAKSRFVLMAGLGARLERSLINLMADTQADRGYKEWWPPVLGDRSTMFGTGQLPKFEDDQFKTTDGLYLIPTAEVALTNIHAGEILEADDLPLHYCAYTACFRKEAGAAGRDTRGMIRVHQFDKVELVKITRPEESLDALEAMVADAERILQLLGLPYRVIELCTGDLGFASAKTYDLEVWMPSYDGYKEISSCSDCWDFQARRAGIRFRSPGEFRGTRLVHTLNGSGIAVGRCAAAVIENYQREDGSIEVPEALRPYMRVDSITAADS